MSLEFIPISNISPNFGNTNSIIFKSLSMFSNYYKEYYQDRFLDLSFSVIDNQQLLGYVVCTSLDQKLTVPNSGVKIALSESISRKHQKTIYNYILGHLFQLVECYRCTGIVIKDVLCGEALSVFGELLFNKRFESKLTFEMNIGFSDFTEESFHASLRKSYRSLINWGKNELETIFINKNNLEIFWFKEFQEFHYKISGRKTRTDETWELQYQMVREGIGELIISTYEGQLVAGALFADDGDVSVYFTGVYERELFKFGISHFLLYKGILHSHIRNQTHRFSLGYFDTDIKDHKWYNIQFFKKGFCNELVPVIFWSKEV